MDDESTRRRRFLALGGTALAAGLAGCLSSLTAGVGEEQPPGRIALEPVVSGLEKPLGFEVAPGDRETFYVAEQTGRIRAVREGAVAGTFLDVRDRLAESASETGLLGFAFHPDYAENGRLFVRYSAPPPADSDLHHIELLSEFSVDDAGVDHESERVLLRVPQPRYYHNAGAVGFGPDGYLYVAFGDGGADDDAQAVAKNRLGSILRIDVDSEASPSPRDGGGGTADSRSDDREYAIPADNPLVGREGYDELYAWGFRNPWRFSWGPDGRFLVADVGQDKFEEVNVVEKGGNYGWNVREGPDCYDALFCSGKSDTGPYLDPVIAYPHDGAAVSGIAVIGGYVHRGDLSALRGEYVFGDLTGGLFAATPAPEGEDWPPRRLLVEGGEDGMPPAPIVAFGEDHDGALYVCLFDGSVARLVEPSGIDRDR